MNVSRRSGADSRCCRPGDGPFRWRDFVDVSHPSVLAYGAWLGTLAPFARAHEEGEIEDLLDAAMRGELWDSGDETTLIKPVRRDPEIYELRRTALSKKLRFYHGEPATLPADLVALHRHIKTGAASQQVEIEHAAQRYVEGRPEEWWMPGKG